MSPHDDSRRDLRADAPQDVIALAERLERERPVPSAAFRGDLRRRLLSGTGTGAGAGAGRLPARVRVLIFGYASAGSVLLAVGAASVAGIGPLGA